MNKTPPPKDLPVLAGQISLDDYLNQLDGPLPEQGTDVTADDTVASRMLRELGTLEKAVAANSSMATLERAKITAWETSVNEPLQNRALWLRSQLEQYALHERREHERKTISLPFGTLSTRPKDATWEIGPEFTAWAIEGNKELLRIKYEPDKTAVKNAFEVDSEGNATDQIGTVIPGIRVVKDADYSVTVKAS